MGFSLVDPSPTNITVLLSLPSIEWVTRAVVGASVLVVTYLLVSCMQGSSRAKGNTRGARVKTYREIWEQEGPQEASDGEEPEQTDPDWGLM